jgi:hypothetical protein
LARSGEYERRALFELDARAQYAGAKPDSSALFAVRDREAQLLRELLDGVQVLEVTAPFPTDPRRIADALAQWY